MDNKSGPLPYCEEGRDRWAQLPDDNHGTYWAFVVSFFQPESLGVVGAGEVGCAAAPVSLDDFCGT